MTKQGLDSGNQPSFIDPDMAADGGPVVMELSSFSPSSPVGMPSRASILYEAQDHQVQMVQVDEHSSEYGGARVYAALTSAVILAACLACLGGKAGDPSVTVTAKSFSDRPTGAASATATSTLLPLQTATETPLATNALIPPSVTPSITPEPSRTPRAVPEPALDMRIAGPIGTVIFFNDPWTTNPATATLRTATLNGIIVETKYDKDRDIWWVKVKSLNIVNPDVWVNWTLLQEQAKSPPATRMPGVAPQPSRPKATVFADASLEGGVLTTGEGLIGGASFRYNQVLGWGATLRNDGVCPNLKKDDKDTAGQESVGHLVLTVDSVDVGARSFNAPQGTTIVIGPNTRWYTAKGNTGGLVSSGNLLSALSKIDHPIVRVFPANQAACTGGPDAPSMDAISVKVTFAAKFVGQKVIAAAVVVQIP